MSALTLQEVARALGGEVSGGQVLAPGPNHSKADRSLSVRLAEDAPDGFVVNPFSPKDDPLAAKDYVRAKLGLPAWQPAERKNWTAEYVYKTADGAPYLKVRRIDEPGGKKSYPQFRWEGGRWVPGKPRGGKIPYRLDEMLRALKGVAHNTVFVTEGEKCADALWRLGLIATSAPEGAGKWTADLNPHFRGLIVYVLADNDAPGDAHATKVANNLHGIAAEVRVVRFPELAEGDDVADWIDAGGTATALVDRCKAQPVWTGEGAVPLSQSLRARDSGTAEGRLVIDTLAGLGRVALPKRDRLLTPILAAKSLSMLYASRGTGKTFVAHGIGYAAASGGSFLRWSAERPRKVFLVDGEMPAEMLQERFRTMRAGAGSEPPAEDFFRVLSLDRQELGVSLNLARPEDQARIEANLGDAELLILDNISTLVSGGRENDAESWDTMQPWLLGLRRQGVSVMLVAHAGRGENARGTSKREDVLDTVIQLRRPEDYDPEEGARFEVRLTKARGVFGEDAAPFEAKLEVRDGADFWSAATVRDLRFEQVLELSRAGSSVREIEATLGLSKSTVNRIQAKARAEGKL